MPPHLLNWPSKTSLEEVAEQYNTTCGMVRSGILEYRRSVEVLNKYTIGSGIEVNPEGQFFDFKKVELKLRGKHDNRISTSSDENHNMRTTIWNTQG